MIVKSRLYHKPGFGHFLLHWLVRGYNALSSVFYSPVNNEIGFVFVVGCGHSGTTLMAAKLGNHPDIFALGRETGVMLPGKYSLYAMKAVADEWSYFAESNGNKLVLEKTPKHLYSYRAIQKVVPNNKFIVLVRNPLDNVASLHKRFNDLDYAIERWLFDTAQALRLDQQDNVKLVRYEDFTREPETTLRSICGFLGLEYRNGMLEETSSIYDKVKQIDNMKLRRDQVNKPVTANEGGWRKVFDEGQAREILARAGSLVEKLGYDANKLLNH